MLITESSIMQANKNFFNKIRSCLLKESKKDQRMAFNNLRADVFFSNLNKGDTLIMFYRYNIKDIKFVEEREKVYVLALIELEIDRMGVYFRDGSGDCALNYMRRMIYFGYFGDKEGFPNGDKTTDDEILKSGVYNLTKKIINEFLSSEIITVLNSKVYPQLKIRENVIPLAVYNSKDGTLNYPYSRLYSSNLMSTSTRSNKGKVEVMEDLSDIVLNCLRNTPFTKWLTLKSSYPVEISLGSEY